MPEFRVILRYRTSAQSSGGEHVSLFKTTAPSESEARLWAERQADQMFPAARGFSVEVEILPIRPAQAQLF